MKASTLIEQLKTAAFLPKFELPAVTNTASSANRLASEISAAMSLNQCLVEIYHLLIARIVL